MAFKKTIMYLFFGIEFLFYMNYLLKNYRLFSLKGIYVENKD